MEETLSPSVEKVSVWRCPEGTGAPIITMPNIPKPLHGPGMQPRTIYGQKTWDILRKKAYFNADYKCEICGREPKKGDLHAHELFTYDYENTTGTFERIVAICRTCHDGIHSGRLITMFKNGNPIYNKRYVLKVVENAFSVVNRYNAEHPDSKLKLYDTFLEYLNVPELREEMLALIDKYDVEFWSAHITKSKRWKGWKVIVNGKEYWSKFNSQKEWEEGMAKMNNDTMRNVEDPFKSEIMDEINAILAENGLD